MHIETINYKPEQREDYYQQLLEQLRSLLEGETNRIANLANAAALLYHSLEDINWAGFYLYEQGELIVGPFQGKPACVHIALGKGVCGTAAQQQQTVRVANVHQFAGHIACDSASNAEIVIPLLKDGQLLGVLDIDSPREDRFDELDQKYLEAFAQIVIAAS
jgi:L-methionine (R)-S-oxide reductase